MIRILFTFFFIALAFPAFACSPPVTWLPQTEEMTHINKLQAEGTALNTEQSARFNEYKADETRAAFLWSQLNPCPMDPELVKAFEALTPEQKQALEAEQKTLQEKWTTANAD